MITVKHKKKVFLNEYFLAVILILSLALFGSAAAQNAKYCDATLCTSWDKVVSKHIGCPGTAVNKCPAGAVKTTMTAELKTFILDKHNTYRNTLAGGGVAGLSGAVQMPTLVSYTLNLLKSKTFQ